ncbi:MAG: thiamine-phosphate kinase, partial [Dongiaceae bacterium]
PELRERIIAGGDDYELLLTVAAADVPAALSLAQRERGALTPIGHITAGSEVRIVDESGGEMAINGTGYRHF